MQLLHCKLSPDHSGMICPLWSMLTIITSLSSFHMFRHVFQDSLLNNLTGNGLIRSFQGHPLHPFLKIHMMCPFFQSLRISPDCKYLSNMIQTSLTTLCSSSLMILGCTWSWVAFLAYFLASTFAELHVPVYSLVPIYQLVLSLFHRVVNLWILFSSVTFSGDKFLKFITVFITICFTIISSSFKLISPSSCPLIIKSCPLIIKCFTFLSQSIASLCLCLFNLQSF